MTSALDRIVQECAEAHREPRVPGKVAPQVTWPAHAKWGDGLMTADGTGTFDVAVWPALKVLGGFGYRWLVTNKADPSAEEFGWADSRETAKTVAETVYLARTQSQMAAE